LKIHINIYPTVFQNESKILKVTRSLVEAKLFDNIHIVGIHKEGFPENETIEFNRKVWRVRLNINFPVPIIRGIIVYLEWYLKVIFKFRYIKHGVVHCNSIEDLPLGVIIKLLKNKIKVVYDTHELETEKNGLHGYNKKVAKFIERLFIRRVDAVMVVCGSIKQWYEDQYGLDNVYLIKNMPYKSMQKEVSTSNYFREHFEINNGTIFLYHGCFNKGRGIELLLEVFAKMNADKHIVFMGYGHLTEEIKKYTVHYDNIHFMDAVDPSQVISYASGADIGLSVFENICLSHYYVLPNKLYEYLLSGLPVIVSNFPDMSEVIDTYNNGWKIEPKFDQLSQLIRSLKPEEIEEKRVNVLSSQEYIGWETQEKILVNMYKEILE